MNYSHFSLWYVQYAIHDKCREISSPLLSWLNTLDTFRRALAEWGFGWWWWWWGRERETPLEFYNITICLQTGGWRRRPSASIFFVFFVFFCVLCWRERAAGGSARKDLAENQNMSSLFRCFFTSLNLFPLGANERTKGMRSHTIFQVILLCLLVRVPQTNTTKEATDAFLI